MKDMRFASTPPLALLLVAAALAGCGDSTEPSPTPAVCGNGVIEDGEQCDDGNNVDGDGCSATCQNEDVGGGDTEICDDEIDNDGDGLTDCDDPDCVGDAACEEAPVDEICDDGIDNDGDGDTDCDDADCADDPACAVGPVDEICDDGIDNDGDGDTDCDDADCADDPACAVVEPEICDDEIDNDGDGRTDCADPDCIGDPACEGEPIPEICDDEIDNDEDGDTDCDDADCALDPACVVVVDPEICDDEIDNDGDGRTDCADPDCIDDPACEGEPIPEICDDGIDNDEDGDTDCDDEDCALDPACVVVVVPEICDDEIDNDGDGDIDCDDEDCADDPACAAIDPFCGDGTVDEEEECDDGEGNSDRLPDACRTDCTFASCGDGVVDTDEACDAGDDNDDAGVCTTSCTINLDVACAEIPDLVDLNEAATAEGAGLRWEGTFRGAGEDFAPAAGCSDAGNGRDRTFVFTADADGDLLLTTEVAGTFAPTAIYLLESCLDPLPGTCAATEGTREGSSLVVRDVAAGDTLLFVVDEVPSENAGTGAFALEVVPFASTADVGASCDPSSGVICDGESICTPGAGGSFCSVDVAPVISDVSIDLLSSDGLARITVTGTDANSDPFDLFINSVTLEGGTVVEGPFSFTNRVVPAIDGENFTFSVTTNFSGIGGNTGRPTAASFLILDEAGNLSEPGEGLYPPYPAAVANLGEACDETTACERGLFCVPGEGETDVCDVGTPPVLTNVTTRWVDETTIQFTYEGSDVDGDAYGSLVLSAVEGETGDVVFLVFDSIVWDGDDFVATASQTGYPGAAAGDGASEFLTLVWDETDFIQNSRSGVVSGLYPLKPEGAGLGGACVAGDLEQRCDDGLVCNTASVCAIPTAPVLTSVFASVVEGGDGSTINVTFEGSDRDGDMTTPIVIYYDAELGLVDAFGFNGALLTPPTVGRTSFRSSIVLEDVPDTVVFVGVLLEDSTGLTSRIVIDPLAPGLAEGETCTFEADQLGRGQCSAADGLACGATGTCEVAAAPVLTAASVARPSGDVLELTFDGSDANGDVFVFGFEIVIGTTGLGEQTFAFVNPPLGETTFSVTELLPGATGLPDASIDLWVVDGTRLASNRIRVPIPPERSLGETCSGDPAIDACTEGLECIEGTCFGYPPTLTFVDASYDASRRNLLVFARGETLGNEMVSLDLFFTSTIDPEFEVELLIELASLPEDDFFVEDGEWFAFVEIGANFLFFNGADTLLATATAVSGLTTESVEASFAPALLPFEECELESDAAVCPSGYLCTDLDPAPLCVYDEADFCGGVVAVELTDVLTFDEEYGGFRGVIDLAVFDNIEVETCDGGASDGPEVVLYFFLDEPATVLVTTDFETTNADTYVYVREDFCAYQDATIACNDDTVGLNSEVVLEAVANVPYFVYIDSWADPEAESSLVEVGFQLSAP